MSAKKHPQLPFPPSLIQSSEQRRVQAASVLIYLKAVAIAFNQILTITTTIDQSGKFKLISFFVWTLALGQKKTWHFHTIEIWMKQFIIKNIEKIFLLKSISLLSVEISWMNFQYTKFNVHSTGRKIRKIFRSI